MNHSVQTHRLLTRRERTACSRALASLFCFILLSGSSPANNLIEIENQQPGTRDWQLTRVKVDAGGCRSTNIEGYCSKQSVRAGDSLDIMVSSKPARDFKMEFFRTGYYGGRGARLMKTIDRVQGVTQPEPAIGEKDLHECQWSPSLTLTIPEDWISGVYLGRMTTIPDGVEPYWQSYVIFIVKDDRPTDVLFQCSDNTWQAYNVWPSHYSVYTHPKGGQGPWADVSFDRPYGRESQYTSVVNDPLTVGAGEFIPYEFPMTYWLEQQGYDVTYCSNSDMITPKRGLKCKAFISIGHDEYWDIRQFESVSKMRDEGVDLLFLSGNSVCWVTPLRESSTGNPNRIFFRGGPYGAENEYAKGRERDNGPFPFRGPDEGLLMGARNIEPVNGGGDWVVTKADHWMFEGADVKNGEFIPGLIGWEYHGQPADLPGLEVVAAGTAWQDGVNPQQWTATIYLGPKNNFVFNAATIWWAQALGDPPGHTLPWSHHSRPHGPDDRVQKMTANLLKKAIEN
jgi:hypothetical protein